MTDTRLPIGALMEYLTAQGFAISARDLTAELISGGRSNLTYAVTAPGRAWVLRRPPLGHVLPTAHDMSREYRVISALWPTAVPVPHSVLLCQQAGPLGAPFYLMERVDGVVHRTVTDSADFGPEEQRRLAEALIDVLADLHGIDPVTVGLGDFGRPDGFLARQVHRWTRQLASSRSRDLPGMDDLAARLAASVPTGHEAAILHGDYRLDNCVARGSSIAAVLDWEMSTLGDPLTDVALFALYYGGLAGTPNAVVESPAGSGGFPATAELLDRYAARSGRDLSPLDWYLAFAWFKFAVILEGIHYRRTLGLTAGEGFEGVAKLVPAAIRHGLNALAGQGVPT